MSPTAFRRASKQATTSVRETVRPDELPWPTLHSFDTSYLSRGSRQELLDHWNPTSVVRLCQARDWGNGVWGLVETLEDLTSYEYVRMVGKSYTSVIVIESDNDGDRVTYEDLKNFPIPPSYVGLRTSWDQPWKRGRWYGVWLLEEAVTSPGSFDYLRRVRPAMVEALGGDKGFGEKTLGRSPFYTGADADYSWAHLHSHKVTLTDLRIATEDFQRDFGAPVPTKGSDSGRYPVETLPLEVADQPESSRPAQADRRSTHELWERDSEGTIQRDNSLFHEAQRWAFPVARSGVTVQEGPLLAHLLELNRLLDADLDGTGSGSLDRRQVEKIARSVARYCARTTITGPKGGDGSRWTPEQRRRGGLARAAQESAQDARVDGGKIGGEKSAKVRRGHRDLRRQSVQDHLERGLAISEIAEIEGVSVKTIRRDVEAVRGATTGTKGVQPTERATFVSQSNEQAQEPVETPDPISSESPEDEQDVENVEPDSVRLSESLSGSPESPLRRPETRRDRGRRLRAELRATDPDDTIWW